MIIWRPYFIYLSLQNFIKALAIKFFLEVL